MVKVTSSHGLPLPNSVRRWFEAQATQPGSFRSFYVLLRIRSYFLSSPFVPFLAPHPSVSFSRSFVLKVRSPRNGCWYVLRVLVNHNNFTQFYYCLIKSSAGLKFKPDKNFNRSDEIPYRSEHSLLPHLNKTTQLDSSRETKLSSYDTSQHTSQHEASRPRRRPPLALRLPRQRRCSHHTHQA